MNIGILGSSFLFPGNLAWDCIDVKKIFCEIGDFKILKDTYQCITSEIKQINI